MTHVLFPPRNIAFPRIVVSSPPKADFGHPRSHQGPQGPILDPRDPPWASKDRTLGPRGSHPRIQGPWNQEDLPKNPYTLTRCPPTQFTFSGKIRSATKLSRRPFHASTGCRCLGPKGAQRDPRTKGGQGTQGRLRRPWGNGPLEPSGVIPKPFRMESHFEWKGISKGRPFRMAKHSEWKTIAYGKIQSETITNSFRKHSVFKTFESYRGWARAEPFKQHSTRISTEATQKKNLLSNPSRDPSSNV